MLDDRRGSEDEGANASDGAANARPAKQTAIWEQDILDCSHCLSSDRTQEPTLVLMCSPFLTTDNDSLPFRQSKGFFGFAFRFETMKADTFKYASHSWRDPRNLEQIRSFGKL